MGEPPAHDVVGSDIRFAYCRFAILCVPHVYDWCLTLLLCMCLLIETARLTAHVVVDLSVLCRGRVRWCFLRDTTSLLYMYSLSFGIMLSHVVD